MQRVDLACFPTPYFLVDEARLRRNLSRLKEVSDRTGCRILLAQKAFSMYSVYPIMREYLAGSTASGLYEARLGHEHFGGETHVFSPAYREEEFEQILQFANHLVFNSPAQLRRYALRAKAAGKSVGLRINPEHSTQEGHAIYDPCAPGSRLGTTLSNFDESLLPLLDGLHFHTLCEQNSDDLEATAKAFEERFGKYLHQLHWLNFGGGHHITRPDYDIPRLISVIEHFRDRYDVQIYLEPGEATVYHAGFLVSSVLETMHNGMEIAILDTSAACHMPDVLEMPYLPPLLGTDETEEGGITVRLGGPTCLSGDVIGEYRFRQLPEYGDLLMFGDMAIYTTCKNNTFNGMSLPNIWLRHADNTMQQLTEFGYMDFKERLGSRE